MYPKKFTISANGFLVLVDQILGDLSEVSSKDSSFARSVSLRCGGLIDLADSGHNGVKELLLNDDLLQQHAGDARGSVLRFSYDKNIEPFVPRGHGYTKDSERRMLNNPIFREIQSTMEAFYDLRRRAGGRCWMTLHGIYAMGAPGQHELVIKWEIE